MLYVHSAWSQEGGVAIFLSLTRTLNYHVCKGCILPVVWLWHLKHREEAGSVVIRLELKSWDVQEQGDRRTEILCHEEKEARSVIAAVAVTLPLNVKQAQFLSNNFSAVTPIYRKVADQVSSQIELHGLLYPPQTLSYSETLLFKHLFCLGFFHSSNYP